MRFARLLAGLLALLSFWGCERDTPTAEEREAVTSLARAFLLALARSYSEMDPKYLEGIAAPRFINETYDAILTLRANGDRLEPVLVQLEITDIKVLRHANAYVFCTETWDTRRLDVASGVLKGHDPNSVLHSVIQMKKLKGGWVVLYREVEETATGPRFLVRTPRAPRS
ncbi:MAG: hypothetical protein NZ869_10675 [Thermoanaerobaculum sp.]|nr:hypothetical protein [Thermoanaerobaculum sp.]MDW7968382.1 hypothetical protein [Thermoanaerobaculum sp.]